MPVPGIPTVLRVPRRPSVTLAPFGPNDVDSPDLLRLIVTPGATLNRRKSRKYPIARRMPSREGAGYRPTAPSLDFASGPREFVDWQSSWLVSAETRTGRGPRKTSSCRLPTCDLEHATNHPDSTC
jgi:hypothetical protein